jgi:hypothetical protein
VLASALDFKRWTKIFHAAIRSTALDHTTKTTDQAAQDMPAVLELWNETVPVIERVTDRPFAPVMQANAHSFWFRKIDSYDARQAIATLDELSRQDLSDDLKWRVNWMRDLLFSAGLSAKRIEHEATSARGWWWTKGRKTKIAMAAQDAKRHWDREVELRADQHTEKRRDLVRTLKGLNNRMLNSVRETPGYEDFTSRGFVHHDPKTKWPGYKRDE